MRKAFLGTIGAGVAGAFLASAAWAAELPKTHVTGVGLNANTVARVYRDLQTTGVLRLERGVGTFVASTAAAPLDKRQRQSIEKTTDKLIGLALAADMSPSEVAQLIETRWKEVNHATR